MTTSSMKHWPLFRYLGRQLFANFVVPTTRMVRLVLLGSLLIILGFALEMGMFVFWSYNVLLLVFSLIDLMLLPRRKIWTLKRLLPERVDVRENFAVQLVLSAGQRQSFQIQIELTDDLPMTFVGESGRIDAISSSCDSRLADPANPIISGIVGERDLTLSYTARAMERGHYTFKYVVLRYYGGIGLWKKQVRIEQPQEIRVYPDLSQVRGVLSTMQNTLILEGQRLLKKQRSGSDFDQVRDYIQGDEPKHINWKASARTARLMTNLYQPEKGKIVTLLIDSGRMMGIELDGQTKLDLSLEAALALAAVALKQGDQVALLAFSNRVKIYVPPGKGLTHLQELTRSVYDLKFDFVESSFSLTMAYLMRVQRKRSLIMLFSDMESYLHDKEYLPYAERLRRRNHLLLLSLNDPVLHHWVRIRAVESRTAYIQSIAHKFTVDRKTYAFEMAGRGIPVLDVPADRLTLSAVNAYLELKSRDIL